MLPSPSRPRRSRARRRAPLVALAVAAAGVGGWGLVERDTEAEASAPARVEAPAVERASPTSGASARLTLPPVAGTAASATPSATPAARGSASNRPDVVPRGDVRDVRGPAFLDVPSIGLRRLRVIPYTGSPDDAAGTAIQDHGIAASPLGDDGGVGVGRVGNYIVTGHRSSHGGPLRRVPEIPVGEHALITVAGTVFDYVIRSTRTVSFRSARSLAEQAAAVPGRPGQQPTQAALTLSTCATPEDHAAGNYWTDALGNPEHRIDKIGVLVAVRTVAG